MDNITRLHEQYPCIINNHVKNFVKKSPSKRSYASSYNYNSLIQLCSLLLKMISMHHSMDIQICIRDVSLYSRRKINSMQRATGQPRETKHGFIEEKLHREIIINKNNNNLII